MGNSDIPAAGKVAQAFLPVGMGNSDIPAAGKVAQPQSKG